MTEDLRVGIAGTGFIGRVHGRAARLAGGRLAGVSASSPARAQAAATELHAERAYKSSGALATDAGIDVVHVCTPNHLHVELAEAALGAGKHVVCEKPIALDTAGARRLNELAAGKPGTVAAVPFVYRYHPVIREARARVRAGDIGAVHLLHGTYLQDWLLRPDDDNWRVDSSLGGASRAFADIGSHWCDLAEFVSGHRITRVSARTSRVFDERAADDGRHAFTADRNGRATARRPVDTEDTAVVHFETDRGALGSVVVSQVSAGRKNRLWLELDGADAALAFNQEEPETLWRGARESVTLIKRDPQHLGPDAARLATLPAGHPQGYADCFDLFVADVYATIRTGQAPDGMPVFADGLRAALITEAVLRSAADQRWVEVAQPIGVKA